MCVNLFGRFLGVLFLDKVFSVVLFKLVIFKRVGNGMFKVFVMEFMILREGLVFLLVKLDRNDMDIFVFLVRLCFVIFCFLSRCKMFVKNIWLYMVGYVL